MENIEEIEHAKKIEVYRKDLYRRTVEIDELFKKQNPLYKSSVDIEYFGE